MNKTLILSVLMLIGVLSACQKDEISKADTPAQTVQEARARLVAKEKWIIDELLLNKESLYKRGSQDTNLLDLGVEWLRFGEDGTFEVKYVDEAQTEKSKYKIDEATNRVLFFFDLDGSVETLEYAIEAGSVYEDHFSMSSSFEDYTFEMKLVALP